MNACRAGVGLWCPGMQPTKPGKILLWQTGVLPIEGTALAKAEMEENKEMKQRVS